MTKGLTLDADAEVVNEGTIFEYSYAGGRIGDGVININFTTDDPKEGIFGDPDYLVGTISVLSNGFMDFYCDDARYTKDVYDIYRKIYGPNCPVLDTSKEIMHIPYVCDTIDKHRFSRAKKFVVDNNIPFRYSQDILMDTEEMTGRKISDDEFGDFHR